MKYSFSNAFTLTKWTRLTGQGCGPGLWFRKLVHFGTGEVLWSVRSAQRGRARDNSWCSVQSLTGRRQRQQAAGASVTDPESLSCGGFGALAKQKPPSSCQICLHSD